MKNPKRGPLSIRAIFYAKMLSFMLLTLIIGVAKAQPLTLVKDINTPQIADLRNSIVYAVGNKIYSSDGTANGTRIVYTGAADATITLSGTGSYYAPVSRLFLEKTPNSAKIARFTFTAVETIVNVNGRALTNFYYYNGFAYYVVNGNELWSIKDNASPRLIKAFNTPITNFIGTYITTANSVWYIDYYQQTIALAKDGFTEIGEFTGYYFAANDGGFNGTELWQTNGASTPYLVQDINPNGASSNPRNFKDGYFTATSNGQNGIYSNSNFTLNRLVIAPSNTELKAAFGFSPRYEDGSYRYTLAYTAQTASGVTLNAVRTDSSAITRQIARFTEGSVSYNSNYGNMFTHTKNNGTRDIWTFDFANGTSALLIPNAAIEGIESSYVYGDDGKLWLLNRDGQTPTTTLVRDFGVGSKLQYHGQLSRYVANYSRYTTIFTQTINGVTKTFAIIYDNTNRGVVSDISTLTYPENEYSSFPTDFQEINGKVLFNAADGERGRELWRTDGTTAGTTLFKEFKEGPFGNLGKSLKYNGFMYYQIPDLEGAGSTFWKTDGTTIDSLRSNTTEYQNIRNRFIFNLDFPSLTFESARYQTYYSSYAGCSGRGCPTFYQGGIQRFFGTDTSFVFSFNYVNTPTEPIKSLHSFGNLFYFSFNEKLTTSSGNGGDLRGALWLTNGTAAGTTILKSFTKRPTEPLVVGNKLFFCADDGINGMALWSLTVGGSLQVVSNFVAPNAPKDIVIHRTYQNNGNLYFITTRNSYTNDSASLWGFRVNGGNAVVKLMDLTDQFNPTESKSVVFNNALLLSQTRNDVGTELFKIPLLDAPLGGPLSNQSDLTLTQTVTSSRLLDTVYLDFALTVKNNGGQTAANVQTGFTGLSLLGLTDTRSFRDTVTSMGYLLPSYFSTPYWFIPSLGANQTATLRLRVAVRKENQVRTKIYTSVKSDQFDANVADNAVEYQTELSLPPCVAPTVGGLLVDYYTDIVDDGSPVQVPTRTPTGSYLSTGAIANNLGDQYIRRARGYIKPSESGNYRFYIAGDDNVDVYLSTDDNPANKQRISYVQGYTSYTQFNKYASQTSASINLTAGRRYYVEIVNADKFGDDFFNLQWTTPSVSARNFIPVEKVESFCGDAVVVNLPDLTLQNLVVRDPSVSAGQNINVTIEAKNIGNATANGNNVITCYYSTDQTLDASDVAFGTIGLGTLAAGQILRSINLPWFTTGVVPGNYYIIAKIDPDNLVNESNENNNVLVSASTVTILPNVVPLLDLTLRDLNVTNTNVQQGNTLVVSVKVANLGTDTTGNFVVKGYLSTDNSLSPNDLQVVIITGGTYAPSYASPDLIGNIPIPASFPTGQYYLFVVVDANNDVRETDETNNTLISPTLITINAQNVNAYCASKGVAPWEYAISKVTLNTLNNNSDKFKDFNTLGYSDYTDFTATLTKGQTYPLSITPLLSWIGNLPNAYARVWIDFNQNKTFEANELVLEKTNANPLTQNVLVPTTALIGSTRMRVSLKNGAYPTACETFEKGEVEDYTVNIAEETTATGIDTLKIISAISPVTFTPNGNATVTLTIENVGNAANDPSKPFRLSNLGNIFGRRTTSYFFSGISNDTPIGVSIPAKSTRTVNLTFRVNSNFTHKQPLRVPSTPLYGGIHVGLSNISEFSNFGNPIDTLPFRLVPQPTAVLPTSDLSLTTTTPTVAYTGNTIRYTLKVKNNSATSIPEVQVPTYSLSFLTTESVLTASKGTTVVYNQTDPIGFDILSAGYWNVGTLAAGEEATCQVQVSATPFDFDQSEWEFAPIVQSIRINETNSGNNTARIIARRNATANLPDLTLANLSPRDPSVSQGQNVNFTFDAKNIGTAAATNAFTIKSYLSTDAVLDANDYQNGSIPTANYAAGATIANIQGSLNVANTVAVGNYYLILKIDADNQITESNEANNVLVSTNTIAIIAVSTTTYCTSKGVAPWEYAISNVSLFTLNNNSDKFKDINTLGYSDYTNLSTTLTKGQTYPLSITPLLSWIGNLPNAYARVWIDFNQNKTFEANELVLEKTNANPLTQNVLVPTMALTGSTRMRVSLKNGAYPTACETFDKGEVEDYLVNIQLSSSTCFVVNCPPNITVNATTNSAIVTWTEPTISGTSCGGSVFSPNFRSGSTFPLGTTNVTYSIINTSDGTSSNNNCRFNVTVVNTSGGTSDIALTLTSTPSVYRQYSTQNFRVSAKNLGSQAFTNVKIKFSRPALTVSGGTKVASIGTFQDFCPNNVECSEWTIPTLAGGTTATLDVPIYVLNPTSGITATASLLSSNPVDNNVANNTATVTINLATTPAVQPLIQSKPTQLIPVVIQKIAPTITENYIIVELESIEDKTIDFQILNALGNVVLTEKIEIDKGNNKFDFNVSQLPKGMYFIQTSVGKGRNVPMKFVKY